MYTGYLLTDKSRNMLLAQFPPKYQKVVAHHVTEAFGTPADAPAPAQPDTITVVGYIDSGDGVEGLLVAVNGSVERPDGSKYHCTWSLDDGRKAVETNKYVDSATDVEPVAFEVEPKNFGSRLNSLKEAMTAPKQISEMTLLTNGYPEEARSVHTLELVKREGKKIGNLDNRDIYLLSSNGTLIYAVGPTGQDTRQIDDSTPPPAADKLVAFIQCKDIKVLGETYLQLLVAYCLPAHRNAGETTRLLWFIKNQEGKHLIDYGSVTVDGLQFYAKLNRTGRLNVHWMNITNGEKTDFIKGKSQALSKLRQTDWRIVIEGKDTYPLTRFMNESHNLGDRSMQVLEDKGP